MINIDLNNLNVLEKQIYDTLLDYSKSNERLRIIKAAELCDCSVSKISKYVKKLGFSNFKQYLDFLYGMDMQESEHSNELERIKGFINEFDPALADEFLDLIN
jgi:DNA-binding MurR/RpiR family transcriptional regulator